MQRVALILHEADERSQHEPGSVEQPRRKLIREGLSRAGRHDRDAVPALEHGIDDLPLAGAELVETEHVSQNALWLGSGHAGSAEEGRSAQAT